MFVRRVLVGVVSGVGDVMGCGSVVVRRSGRGVAHPYVCTTRVGLSVVMDGDMRGATEYRHGGGLQCW